MSKLSRVKGKVFEREVVDAFRPIFPNAKRGLSQSRDGAECADVEGTPFWIEAKRRRGRVDLQAAYEQAKEASGSDGRPVVVVSRIDRGEMMVHMSAEDFLDIVEGCARYGAILRGAQLEDLSSPELDETSVEAATA